MTDENGRVQIKKNITKLVIPSFQDLMKIGLGVGCGFAMVMPVVLILILIFMALSTIYTGVF